MAEGSGLSICLWLSPCGCLGGCSAGPMWDLRPRKRKTLIPQDIEAPDAYSPIEALSLSNPGLP